MQSSPEVDQVLPSAVGAPLPFRPPLPPAIGDRFGVGSLLGVNAVGLKSKLNAAPAEDITKGNFIAKNFTCSLESAWRKSPVDRIRDIDSVTMYKPSTDECEDLNLTNDRISLKSQYALMLLSGGYKGCRFSSDDINSLLQLSKDLHNAHFEITQIFNSMDKNLRKSKIKSFPASAEESPLLVQYHKTCDDYMSVLQRLQTFIRDKQQSLTAVEKLERGDNDSKVGLPVPKFLSVLMDMYRSMQTNSGNTELNNSTKYRPTIGKLSAFLSCCVVGMIAVDDPEMVDALDELMEASNDTEYSYIYAPQVAQDSPTSTPIYSCYFRSVSSENPSMIRGSHLSKEYVAKRLFCFLSKLAEVKSYITDEKNLYCFDFLPS